MRAARGHISLPSALLTLSLLALVLAVGFVVGRVVVARAYLKMMPDLGEPAAPAPESARAEPPGGAAPGRVYVPAPPPERPRGAEPAEAPAPAGEEPTAEADGPAAAPAPATAPAPQPEGPPAGERRYTIQVGVFVSREGAQQVADELTRAGFPARVEAERADDRTVYRVFTGRYRTDSAARSALEQLKQEGFPGFLAER